MNVSLNNDFLAIVLDSLENTHRELVKKADSWSFDLEGDYDNYLKYRQKELEVAAVIHSVKKQRTARQQNPSSGAEAPLADWEIELLQGGSKPLTFKEFLQHVDINNSTVMEEAVKQGWLTAGEAEAWRSTSNSNRQHLLQEWSNR